MRLFRKPFEPLKLYPGIRLRISTPSGTVVEVDSNDLHYMATFSGEPDWYQLIPGGDQGTTEFTTVPVKIEVKPVRLADAGAL